MSGLRIERMSQNKEAPFKRIQRPSQTSRFADIGTVLLLALVIATFFVVSGFTTPADDSLFTRFGSVFAGSVITVGLWILAASGYGVWCLRWLPEELSVGAGRGTRLLATIGLGSPIQLWITHALGSMGLLDTTTAWIITIGGVILLAQGIRTSSRRLEIGPSDGWLPPLTWTSGPALVVLVIAACSAPGWLWQTEFGGYDAMAYHLQLPREWFEQGQITTSTWNVYSAMPNLFETSFLHLMHLNGGTLASTIPAQLLHATFAVLTAAITAAAIGRWFDRSWMGAGFALVLGTPWVIVVGSLAYNEMFASFMLATAMLLLSPGPGSHAIINRAQRLRVGVLAGVLAASACAAKLSTLGIVAIPIGLLMINKTGRRGWRDAAPVGALAGLVILTPWLARNLIATGNPVFPFATGLFGLGHFSEEQAQRFASGHSSPLGPLGRLTELFNQIFRYGIGPNPYETLGEPWRPQWSILPILASVGLGVGLIRKRTRSTAVRLFVMIFAAMLFWLVATHLKSRFLVPGIPMFIAAVFLLLPEKLPVVSRGRPIIASLLVMWCFLPVLLFQSERLLRTSSEDPGRSISATMTGRMDLATGLQIARLARQEEDLKKRIELLQTGNSNALLSLLPEDRSVLSIGNSIPYLSPRRYEYATVWDDHPLAKILENHLGDPQAAIAALQERGTDLLLVNYPMLLRWQRSGWLDPRLDLPTLDGMLRLLPVEFNWPNGEFLFRVSKDLQQIEIPEESSPSTDSNDSPVELEQ
jgi:hypothetical protein